MIQKNTVDVVTEADILSAPIPDKTSTYTPVPHGKAIKLIEESAHNLNLKLASKTYYGREGYGDRKGMSCQGMLTIWTLTEIECPGMDMMLALTNSYDKSIPWQLAVGSRVFACTNMLISGDAMKFRKHTSNLTDEELLDMSLTTVFKGRRLAEDKAAWMEGLKLQAIPTREMHHHIIRAVQEEVIPRTKVMDIVECLDEEIESWVNAGGSNVPTIWNLLNAFTRYYRERDIFTIRRETAKVENFIQSLEGISKGLDPEKSRLPHKVIPAP